MEDNEELSALPQPSKRSQRRHQYSCKKKRVLRDFDLDKSDPRAVGVATRTGKVVSNCPCCTNQRRQGKVTRNELASEIGLSEGLEEYSEVA